MKTAVIRIDDTDYMAVFNNAVLSRMEETGIKLSDLNNSDQPVSSLAKMFCFMLESGAAWAARKGMGSYPTITAEELLEVTDLHDFETLKNVMAELIVGERQVDAALPKKPGGDTEAAPTN